MALVRSPTSAYLEYSGGGRNVVRNHRSAALNVIARVLPHAFLSVAAIAQTGTIGGTVYRDTLFHQLVGVEISIPLLNRRAVSNYAGDFRLSGIPTGRYVLQLHHIGFAPLTDTVSVTENAAVDREYVMSQEPVVLDSVRVSAEKPRYVSALLNDFVERARHHNGGFFITDSALRKNESRKLQDVLTSVIPGLHTFRPMSGTRPTMEYVSSGRGPTLKGSTCPVALYVNGISIYNMGTMKDPESIPDLSRYTVADYAGIEYYPGGASIPPQYNMTPNSCGVLLLWERER